MTYLFNKKNLQTFVQRCLNSGLIRSCCLRGLLRTLHKLPLSPRHRLEGGHQVSYDAGKLSSKVMTISSSLTGTFKQVSCFASALILLMWFNKPSPFCIMHAKTLRQIKRMYRQTLRLLNVAKGLPRFHMSFATLDVHKLDVHQIEANDGYGILDAPLVIVHYFGIHIWKVELH